MKLLKEILSKVLEKEEINVVFSNLSNDCNELVEMECLKCLNKIKTIIENDSLSDFDCIEEIVCVFEEIGSNGGGRHDFG